jgi:hypothetical protein
MADSTRSIERRSRRRSNIRLRDRVRGSARDGIRLYPKHYERAPTGHWRRLELPNGDGVRTTTVVRGEVPGPTIASSMVLVIRILRRTEPVWRSHLPRGLGHRPSGHVTGLVDESGRELGAAASPIHPSCVGHWRAYCEIRFVPFRQGSSFRWSASCRPTASFATTGNWTEPSGVDKGGQFQLADSFGGRGHRGNVVEENRKADA